MFAEPVLGRKSGDERGGEEGYDADRNEDPEVDSEPIRIPLCIFPTSTIPRPGYGGGSAFTQVKGSH